jgi:Protein of unknown function (DUF3501)
MQKLTREDLFPLEEYARLRPQFRDKVIAHKKNRQLALGPNATLSFEDRLTMQYQIQEMLRVERIFEPQGITDELAAYNPLIPDGTNWKATLLLEFPDAEERRGALARLRGVETQVWARVAGHEPVYAIADEDLERSNESKTSSVHFLRFELAPVMVDALKQGADVAFGIDHAAYRHSIDPAPRPIRDALVLDLGSR